MVNRARSLKLPKVPANIEVSWEDELGFYDAWDAEDFYIWTDNAKKALIKKGVPLAVVNNLWRFLAHRSFKSGCCRSSKAFWIALPSSRKE